MYYPYFIAYITIGLSISLLVFFWALKTGQFKDQQRARFLPLVGATPTTAVKGSKFSRWEIYLLFLLAFLGLTASGAVLLFALYHG